MGDSRKKNKVKETPWWYHLLWGLALVIFKIFFGIEIKDRRNIPLRGAVILASNHCSYLDPIVLGLLTSRKLNFLAKEELFKCFLFKQLITALGAVPLKRDKLDRRAYQKALHLLSQGRILVLFPEGTRSKTQRIGKLRQGTVSIALKAEIPLIPVVIKGTGKALPPGKKLIKLSKIKIRVGKPISVSGILKKEKKSIDILQEKLKEELQKLANSQ